MGGIRMAYVIARNNVFNYGEVGERLSGLRESEIYQQSAKKIENFIINEMGNLKIAKQWQETKLQETESFVALFDTKYPFYVGVGRNYIYTFQKKLEKTLYKSPINGEFKNYKMIENRLFLIGNTTEVYEFDKKDGNIGKSNFMDLIRFPVKDKEQIKIDVYKTYKVGEEIRVSLLGTYTDPKLKSNDGIYLFETEIKLERLYKQYKTSVTKDDIFDVKDGLVFGVLHGFFQKNGQKQYLIGNIPIEFTGETQDKVYGSSYFTGISKNISGEISFGELKELKENLTDIGIFEDRMYVIQDGIFYFSKKGDYFDFFNDTKTDSAFFFRPTPINNVFPEFYSTEVGNRIYATTSKGVYVISAGNVFSSTNYKVYVGSEIPCRDKGVLINDDFYYISDNGDLKCVQLIPNQTGYENYVVSNVEKYDIYNQCESIAKMKYDDRTMLVCTKKRKGSQEENSKTLMFYQALEFNIFRRFSVTSTQSFSNIITLDKYIISVDGTFLTESKKNMQVAKLELNTPFLQTNKGGNYSNDYSSLVERVFIKVLNQDQDAVKGMKIYDTVIAKMPSQDDLFSVFKLETSRKIANGYSIEVTTKENEKVFEILGIDTKIKVSSD